MSFNPFAGGEILKLSPTTIPQKEILASAQISDEANSAFNETVSISISGALNIERLEKSFSVLISRHEILRATFSRKGDEICLQDRSNFALKVIDLKQESQESQREFIHSLWRNIGLSPMNLEEGPLLFAWAISTADDKWELIISAHHLVIDGWSYGILLTELSQIYTENGEEIGLQSPESYLDFAAELASQQVANLDIDYWKEAFSSPPQPLDLPLDFVRPPYRTFSAKRYDHILPEALTRGLSADAAKLRASLVHYMLAAYITLLHRLSGNDDIVVGLPVAGQLTFEKPNLMGHLVQLLPIRASVHSDMPFSVLVEQVKHQVFEANSHPNFSFGKLVEDMNIDRSRVPLISSIFNIDQPFPELNFGGSPGTIYSVPRVAENFELFVNCTPAPGKLTIEVTYSDKLFQEQSIVNWLNAFARILDQARGAADTSLCAFTLQADVPKVLSQLNDNRTEVHFDSVPKGFMHQVELHPEKTAVYDDQSSLSYASLCSLMEGISETLSERGISRHDIVGICSERNVKMLASAMAIMKIGACYLPLDPDFPEDRLTFMLEDSKAKAIICDASAPQSLKSDNLIVIDAAELVSSEADLQDTPLAKGAAEDLAYIIYTSGSTGKPKGVKVPHRSMVNFLESMATEPGLSSEDTLLAVTTLSFDISVLELFLPLIQGASVRIATKTEASDSALLQALLAEPEVTSMQATPATWRMLLADEWQGKSSLKALCGGEALTLNLASQLTSRVGELWNMYGPTETTVWSTCKLIRPEDTQIDIGHPIANTEIYILDSHQNLLPTSIPGELCIGGYGVTLGYIDRDALTQEKFIQHPLLGKLYRTGDLAKVTHDGRLVHLGRMDNQIKIRGFRVELGDIEAAIEGTQGVAQAAVYLWDKNPDDVRLIACCVPETGINLQSMHLRRALKNQLPAYMIPHSFLVLDTLPKTPNGKIDRKRLPKPEIQASALTSSGVLETNEQKLIASIWQELVKPESTIGKEDNFFEIGGHSLLAMEAIRQIEHKTQVRLSPRDFIADKLEALAEKVTQASSSSESEGIDTLDTHAIRRTSPQQNYVLDKQLADPQSSHFNLPASWILSGELDLDAFVSSLEYVVNRQTALRTVVTLDRQLKLAKPGIAEYFTYQDMRNAMSPKESALADIEKLTKQAIMPLNQLLFKARLYRLSEQSYLFFVLPHQTIFDGWSFDILLTELEHIYQAKTTETASKLDRLEIEYRDFATWQSEHSAKAEDLAFFTQNQLSSSFPNLFGASVHDSPQGSCQRYVDHFSLDQLGLIESFAEAQQLKVFELFFGIYALAVVQEVQGSEAIIGVPVAGRNQVEAIALIGSFVTTLPLHLDLQNGTFTALLKTVDTHLSALLDHQSVCLHELQQHDTSKVIAQKIDNSFGFQDIRNRPSKFAELSLEQVDIDRSQTELPFECWVRINANDFQVVYDFDSSKADASIVDRIRERMQQMLTWVIDGHTDQHITLSNESDTSKSKSLWKRLFT